MKSFNFRLHLGKLNLKYSVALLALFLASFYFWEHKSVFLDNIKTLLCADFLTFAVTLGVFLVTFLHKIRFDEISFSNSTLKENIPEIINGITEPSTLLCSFAVLKGLFLQCSFNEQYFPKFNSAEIVFLLIAAAYFFITSFIEIKNDFIQLVTNSSTVEQEQAGEIREEENDN